MFGLNLYFTDIVDHHDVRAKLIRTSNEWPITHWTSLRREEWVWQGSLESPGLLDCVAGLGTRHQRSEDVWEFVPRKFQISQACLHNSPIPKNTSTVCIMLWFQKKSVHWSKRPKIRHSCVYKTSCDYGKVLSIGWQINNHLWLSCSKQQL